MGNKNESVSIGSLTGLELAIRYSCPADQTDLETAKAFEREVGAFRSSGSVQNYVTFRDIETMVVEINQAQKTGCGMKGDITQCSKVVFRG